VYSYDLEALPLEYVEMLPRFIPNEGELKAFKDYERSARQFDDLAAEDKFMWLVSNFLSLLLIFNFNFVSIRFISYYLCFYFFFTHFHNFFRRKLLGGLFVLADCFDPSIIVNSLFRLRQCFPSFICSWFHANCKSWLNCKANTHHFKATLSNSLVAFLFLSHHYLTQLPL